MTDAKELAARLRDRSEYYYIFAHDIRDMSGGASVDADYSEETGLNLREAAAALEAQAEELRKWMQAAEVEAAERRRSHARIAALEQAAAPFVRHIAIGRELMDGPPFDALPDAEPWEMHMRIGDLRALARAAGGAE